MFQPLSPTERQVVVHADPNATTETPTNMSQSGFENFREPEPLLMKGLSAEEIKKMRSYSVEKIGNVDKVVEEAIMLFFSNRVRDCENLLEERLYEDPINLAGAGLVGFLRYCLSMEQPQADSAMQRVEASSSFSSDLHPNPGVVARGMKRIGNAFSKPDPKSKWLKPAEFRAKVIHAECQAIRCFLLILQQSMTAVMKAGLALKRSYSLYSELNKERLERERLGKKSTHEIGLDLNSIYCVDFGLGCINLALSLLPSNVASMLNLIGLSGDRDKGFRLIRRCFDSDTLLSPFASATLLTMFAMLPFFSPILVPSYVPAAKKMADQALAKPNMSKSLLHRWLLSRVYRLERSIEESCSNIEDVLSEPEMAQVVECMPQLRHVAIYDQVINYIILFRWESAIECCRILHTESKWSQIFYLYIEGCCYEMLAHECLLCGEVEKEMEYRKSATLSYWKAMHNKTTILGGKVIRIDQFVAKRLCEITELAGLQHPNPDNRKYIEKLTALPTEDTLLKNLISLPAYEIIVLFNQSHQVPYESFQRMTTDLWKQTQWEIPYSDNESNNALCRAAEAFIKANDIPIAEPLQDAEQLAEIERRVKHMNSITNGYGRMLFYITAIATLMANTEDDAVKEKSFPLLKAVIDSPKYKDKFTSLSYCRPLAIYEQASVTYYTSGHDVKLTLDLLDRFNKQYSNPHYYFHSSIDTKVHLVQQYLKKPTDPMIFAEEKVKITGKEQEIVEEEEIIEDDEASGSIVLSQSRLQRPFPNNKVIYIHLPLIVVFRNRNF